MPNSLFFLPLYLSLSYYTHVFFLYFFHPDFNAYAVVYVPRAVRTPRRCSADAEKSTPRSCSEPRPERCKSVYYYSYYIHISSLSYLALPYHSFPATTPSPAVVHHGRISLPCRVQIDSHRLKIIISVIFWKMCLFDISASRFLEKNSAVDPRLLNQLIYLYIMYI